MWNFTVPLFQPWYIVWLLPLAIAEADERWTDLIGAYANLSVLQWAVQLDPLTTVAIDAWVGVRAVRLWRSESSAGCSWSGLENATAGLGCHASHKAVLALPRNALGLIRTFHGRPVLLPRVGESAPHS